MAVIKGTNAASVKRLSMPLTMSTYSIWIIASFAFFLAFGTHLNGSSTIGDRPPIATVQNSSAIVLAKHQEARIFEAIKIPWVINSPPRGKAEWVNKALNVYQDLGMTQKGAAMLVGNFLQEKPSAFVSGDPCGGALGDGGLAHGFAQWHPGRRVGMPCGFNEQLVWGVNHEMKNHSGGKILYPLLFDENASLEAIEYGLYRWELWGHEGQRFQFGRTLLSQL